MKNAPTVSRELTLLENLMKERSEHSVQIDRLTKQLETVNDRLVQSERLRSNFLSNIKNEINNPLTSILGLISGLDQNTDPKSFAHRIALLNRDAQNLRFQLTNVITAADFEAGTISLQRRYCNMAKAIGHAIDSQNEEKEKKQVRISLKTELPEIIYSDPEMVRLLVANLISNAVKFNHQGGYIRVVAKCEGETLIIEVSDTGIGIPSKESQQIFDRFRQLEMNTSKNYSGHGLGLTLVHEITSLLGGKLALSSEPGVGTKICVRIPLDLQTDSFDEVFAEENIELF